MITIEGSYSFEALVTFLSDPQNPAEMTYSMSIDGVDARTGKTFNLIPLNPSHSSKALRIQSLNSITFMLHDPDFGRLDRYVVVELENKSFLVLSIDSDKSLNNELMPSIANTVLKFLNTEFGLRTITSLQHGVEIDESNPSFNLHAINSVFARENGGLVESTIGDGEAFDKILTAGPSISMLEKSYVASATKNGWNEHHADYLLKFEKDFADFVGVNYAIATSSCTGALHLSLLSLGIGPGDEVLVPDITWVATASAVMYVGAKPVFVDVDPRTWTLNPDLLEGLITNNTKAIIPVHLYGYGALMTEIVNVASKYNLRVIEDAAPAIGTRIHGKLAGSFGDFGCYSFQGAKLLVTGEGGMLVTNDADLYARARKIQDHGRKPGTFWIEELGYKYKMNNITAALGLAQLHRSEHQIYVKRQINAWYREGLADIKGISFQEEAIGTESICWMSSFTLDSTSKVTRDKLIHELKAFGIDSRPVFPSISQYKIWGYVPKVPRVSQQIGNSGINLPSGVMLNKASIFKVVKSIRSILT